jgi:hypothetical protein
MDNGWVKIHRKITDWEWYNDNVTRSVFFDILIHASHNDYSWRGQIISRGQMVSSYSAMAKRLGLSIQNVRTGISKLKSTGELTVQLTNKFSLITVCNYSKYQGDDLTTNRQTNSPANRQLTSNQYIEYQEDKENKKIRRGSAEGGSTPGVLKGESGRGNVTSSEMEAWFASLWLEYPRHVAKAAARKAFNAAIKKAPIGDLLAALEKQKKSPQWNDPKFIPHLSTWLNQERWADEVAEPTVEEYLKELAEIGNMRFQRKYGVAKWESLPAN